jgi:vacuolar protein sorting-associated protein 1
LLKEQFHNVVVAFFKKAMNPTNKLVTDLVAMEATYINTGHPDFLSGHKAMALVNEKHQVSKPVQVDPKTGKPLPAQKDPTNTQSLDNIPGNEGGFFGSFFAAKNKKKLAAMEPPPPVLKASGTLSERETAETEVISMQPQSLHNLTVV